MFGYRRSVLDRGTRGCSPWGWHWCWTPLCRTATGWRGTTAGRGSCPKNRTLKRDTSWILGSQLLTKLPGIRTPSMSTGVNVIKLFSLLLMTIPNELECMYLAITFQSSQTFDGNTRSLPKRKHLKGPPIGLALALPSKSKTWVERVSKDKPSNFIRPRRLWWRKKVYKLTPSVKSFGDLCATPPKQNLTSGTDWHVGSQFTW